MTPGGGSASRRIASALTSVPVAAVSLAAWAVLPALLHAQGLSDLVGRTVTARVVAVADGDTVDVVLPPNRRLRVRLHGVDAPEFREPFSQRARTFARTLLFGRDVDMHGRDIDTYGRLVARLRVDGIDASEALIAEGLACTFRRFSADPALESALDRAQAARRGFWAPNAPQPACVAREARVAEADATARAAGGFVGNVNSRVFHLPHCRNAGCPNCTRRFTTRAEAEAAGFRAAGDCHGQ